MSLIADVVTLLTHSSESGQKWTKLRPEDRHDLYSLPNIGINQEECVVGACGSRERMHVSRGKCRRKCSAVQTCGDRGLMSKRL